VKRALFISLCGLLLCAVAYGGQAGKSWDYVPQSMLQYVDTTGLWRVVGARDMRSYIEAYEESKDWGFGRDFQLMAQEPGDWYSFQIQVRGSNRVILSRESRIIARDKNGKETVGQMCFVTSDYSGANLWDVRKQPLMLRMGIFQEGSVGVPIDVKFKWGKMDWSKVMDFRVEGISVLKIPPEGR